MPEAVKQKMNPVRFIEIFDRYSFEEMGDLMGQLKHIYRTRGEVVKEDLQNSLQSIEQKIQDIDNQISL